MISDGDPSAINIQIGNPNPTPAESMLTTVAVGALAYHGYKRNQSIGGAVLWALVGVMAPVIGGAVALAQGYGKTVK